MFDFLKPKVNLETNKIKPVVLLILDGFGIAQPSEGNAISRAKTPNFNNIKTTYVNGELIASGEAVGLPANEVGNTEVGHLTIGAGRVIFQDLRRIGNAIDDGSFYVNEAFIKAVQHVTNNNSKLHIAGLVGSGNVHSSISHLKALLQFCKSTDMKNVYLHLFTDGRDSPPREAIDVITGIQRQLDSLRIGQIATISGRYYAMDRDRRWDRTQKTFEAMVSGQGVYANSAPEAISANYQQGVTDEFIVPTVILNNSKPVATVDDNDALIFFNFRVDRPRQLTMAFTMPDFEALNAFDFGYVSDTEKTVGKVNFTTFKRSKTPKNLFFVTMTQYQKNIPVSAVAFPPLKIVKTLPEIISANNLKQLHLSESEKERFVTYYFDGMSEQPFLGEESKIVPSPKVATYDKRPQMSVFGIVDEFKAALTRDYYNFFVLNFANADMVGHSGNINAAISAVEYLDKAVGTMVELVLSVGGTLIITADHGNAEEMITYPTGSFFFTTNTGKSNTDHSNNPVPFILISKHQVTPNTDPLRGALSDIAPTILGIMKLQMPPEMTGKNLITING